MEWDPHHTTKNMEWAQLTKIQGPTERHIEQLWDEMQKLKERVKKLENELGEP